MCIFTFACIANLPVTVLSSFSIIEGSEALEGEWTQLDTDEEEGEHSFLEVVGDEDVHCAEGAEEEVCSNFFLADLQKSELQLS